MAKWRRRKSVVFFKQQLLYGFEFLAWVIGCQIFFLFLLFMSPFGDHFLPPGEGRALIEQIMDLTQEAWPLALIYLGVVFALGMLLGHRIYGPLVGMSAVFKRLQSGDASARVYFRKTDYIHFKKDEVNGFLAWVAENTSPAQPAVKTPEQDGEETQG